MFRQIEKLRVLESLELQNSTQQIHRQDWNFCDVDTHTKGNAKLTETDSSTNWKIQSSPKEGATKYTLCIMPPKHLKRETETKPSYLKVTSYLLFQWLQYKFCYLYEVEKTTKIHQLWMYVMSSSTALCTVTTKQMIQTLAGLESSHRNVWQVFILLGRNAVSDRSPPTFRGNLLLAPSGSMINKAINQQELGCTQSHKMESVCFSETSVDLYRLKIISIYLSIYLSMALQSFVGPWRLFQFLNPIHSR
jgi:hypothetical protein